MKKIAIAAAAAMSAAAAGAASVELYGIVDTGLDYTNKDALAGTTQGERLTEGLQFSQGAIFIAKSTPI